MRVSDFHFDLPAELIAQQPLADRAASRMLVVHRAEGRLEDRTFSEFPQFVQPGDCLIINQTRVFPSRLYARRPSGALIEIFLTHPLDEVKRRWEALVRPGRKVRVGDTLQISPRLQAFVEDRGSHGLRILELRCTTDLDTELDAIGHVPLPPYIRREDDATDRERYQTVYARDRGSVAAPTAGLHFTPAILEECVSRGASVAPVTLHVGLGTFAPLHVDELNEVQLHAEPFDISPSSMATIRAASRRIAVGTTSTRAIESSFQLDKLRGDTTLFISPGYQFRAVDALLTNFHLPQSSLLMLVSALAGLELTREAYAHAVAQRYRFFSYGDCMLII